MLIVWNGNPSCEPAGFAGLALLAWLGSAWLSWPGLAWLAFAWLLEVYREGLGTIPIKIQQVAQGYRVVGKIQIQILKVTLGYMGEGKIPIPIQQVTFFVYRGGIYSKVWV